MAWALTLLVLVCAACLATDTDPDLDLWPFFYTARDSETGGRVVEALGPLLEWRQTPYGTARYIRPVHNYVPGDPGRTGGEGETLWPFGFSSRQNNLDRTWFWPFYLRETEDRGTQRERTTTVLIPLFIHRTPTEEKPRDLFVLPFGGVLHDWFGRDRITSVVWPLYVHQESAEAETWSVPWPFLDIIRWKDGGKGWKLWPLYGANDRPGRLRKRFVLWPFYTSVWARDAEGREFNRWMLWPFYGEIRDPKGWAKSWIWPFFWAREDHSEAVRERNSAFPWPFLGSVDGLDGNDVRGRRYWPIFAWERRGCLSRWFALWPLIWRETVSPPEDAPDEERRSYFQVVPFVLYDAIERGSRADTVFQLWPFFKRRVAADGSEEREALSLWPDRWSGGWERNWAPFFRVFGWSRGADGSRSWRVLGRWLRSETGPNRSFFEVKPILRIERAFPAEGKDGKVASLKWRFMAGLLGRDREGGGDFLRLLWFIRLPLGRQAEPGPGQEPR